jgi:hypothetical protein
MEDVPVCEECGYRLMGLREEPPGTVRCPECGLQCDLAAAPRLRPWPGPAWMALRLCGAFAGNVAIVLVVIWLVGLIGVPNLPRLLVATFFIALLFALPLTGLVQPGFVATRLAEQHAIRPRRTAVFLRVYGVAAAVNGVVFVIGLVIAAMLDAW